MRVSRTFKYCWWECKWDRYSGKHFGNFFKLNMHLIYDPAIPLISIYA